MGGPNCARQQQRRAAVEVEHPRHVVRIHVQQRAGAAEAGAVDQQANLQPGRGGADRVEEVVVAEVDGHDARVDGVAHGQFIGQRRQPVGPSRGQDDVQPARGHLPGELAADARRRPGHQRPRAVALREVVVMVR
jgi:hypothetical protein